MHHIPTSGGIICAHNRKTQQSRHERWQLTAYDPFVIVLLLALGPLEGVWQQLQIFVFLVVMDNVYVAWERRCMPLRLAGWSEKTQSLIFYLRNNNNNMLLCWGVTENAATSALLMMAASYASLGVGNGMLYIGGSSSCQDRMNAG